MNWFKKPANLVFGFILLGYLWYAGYYIFRSSFVIEGVRYFALFDDAAISMTYAKNLAAGHGLVWNVGGERVEGFTNPLWVLFMALFHLFPFSPAKIALALQISGAIFLAINLFYVKKIADCLAGHNIVITSIAVILTGFYYPLNTWGLQGMEVSVLALISTAAAWQVIQSMQRNQVCIKTLLLLGVSTLIRMDMVVIYIIVLGVVVWFQPDHRRKHLIYGIGILAFFVGLQTGLRYWYYGEILPNTYYLKMTGIPALFRIRSGIYVLAKLIWNFNWIIFALPLIVLLFRRDREVMLLAGLFAGQVAYSVYVGGDAWEHKGGANRYISTTISLFFVLTAYAFWWIKAYMLEKAFEKDTRFRAVWINSILLVFAFIALLNTNDLLERGDLQRWYLEKRPTFSNGTEDQVRIARSLRKLTMPGTSVGLVSAGNIVYFSDFFAIDFLGKSDAFIAQQDAHLDGGHQNLRPGHNKWDYDYSIGELQPDMVIQLWGDNTQALKYLVPDYWTVTIDGYAFSARKDSERINWDAAEEISPVVP